MRLQRPLVAGAIAISLIACGSNDSASPSGTAASQPSTATSQSRQDVVPAALKSAIATTLKVDESKVTPNASFTKDLGANDIAMVELVMAYEREFKVNIKDADADRFQQVKDVMDYLQQRRVLR